MEKDNTENVVKQDSYSSKDDKLYFYQKRDLKDFLAESILIIFSVLLALIVSEFINKLHEKEKTKNLVKNIVTELRHNKESIKEMQIYNQQVLSKIDSALTYPQFQEKIVSNDEFHLNVIAPAGVLYRYLDNVAWTIAKENDIMSRINFETIAILTRVYEDQDRIAKVENEVADVIFSRTSRDPKQIHATLILIRDNYHGWAVDRMPGLMSLIDEAIKKIETDNSI
jgi:hypothetical protein